MESWNNAKNLDVKRRSGSLHIEMKEYLTKKNILFLFLTVAVGLMMYPPLWDLITSTDHGEYYSHIVLIPLVSGYFMYLKRKELFLKSGNSYALSGPAIVLPVAAITLYYYTMTMKLGLNETDYSSLITFSALIFWVGGFIFFYGMEAFRAAIFPLLFLIFMIPIPTMLMDKIIYFLLIGSAQITYLLYGLLGIPVVREGFTFQLPGLSIEIAKQCSGIRSSLALFITSTLAAQYFLRGGWRKATLIISVIPLAILKNGIRIVTLSLLGIYVDEKFITNGFLHRSGGFVFFIPSLILLGIILFLLRRSESS
jgi:exosortase